MIEVYFKLLILFMMVEISDEQRGWVEKRRDDDNAK